MRKLVVYVAILLLFIFFCPLWMGMWVQHKYHQLLSFYNTQPGIQVKVVDYKRHWASSDIKLAVKIKSAECLDWLKSYGFTVTDLPNTVQFTLIQHIQHGPLVYQETGEYLPIYLGARIHGYVDVSPELSKTFKEWGANEKFVQSYAGIVTLVGNYFAHLQLNNLKLVHLYGEIKFKSAEARLWFQSQGSHVNGDVKITNMRVSNDQDYLLIPVMTVFFDQERRQYGLWVGKHDVNLPEISLWQGGSLLASGFDVHISNIEQEHNAQLNEIKQIDIGKVHFADQVVGPGHLLLTLRKINAKAIIDLVHSYQSMVETGELYKNQFRNEILAKIPRLFNPDSTIVLNTFSLSTPSGQVGMRGDVKWPPSKIAMPDTIPELIDASDAKLVVSVPKEVVDQLIQFALDAPYLVEDISDVDRATAIAAEEELNYYIRQNALLLDQLIQDRVLPEPTGLELFRMQKDADLIDDYTTRVKELLFEKQITLTVSYLLYWQYLHVRQPYDQLMGMTDRYQQSVRRAVEARLAELIQQGYVKEVGKDYYAVSFMWSGGNLTVNGLSPR